jgi:hypothetical protein
MSECPYCKSDVDTKAKLDEALERIKVLEGIIQLYKLVEKTRIAIELHVTELCERCKETFQDDEWERMECHRYNVLNGRYIKACDDLDKALQKE